MYKRFTLIRRDNASQVFFEDYSLQTDIGGLTGSFDGRVPVSGRPLVCPVCCVLLPVLPYVLLCCAHVKRAGYIWLPDNSFGCIFGGLFIIVVQYKYIN